MVHGQDRELETAANLVGSAGLMLPIIADHKRSKYLPNELLKQELSSKQTAIANTEQSADFTPGKIRMNRGRSNTANNFYDAKKQETSIDPYNLIKDKNPNYSIGIITEEGENP